MTTIPAARLTWRRRLSQALLVLALAVAFGAIGPGTAGACACGAYLADDRLEPTHETALVELSGGTQAITMNIAAETEASNAAFLMPVPSQAEFELADAGLFEELDELTRPRIEYREVVVDGDGAGAGAPEDGDHVIVTDHVDVGPYEVAQLTGDDAGAVSDWLGDHGFELPDDLGDELTPYLAEGWLVVAVQLTPESDGADVTEDAATFADGLPPMRLSFETTQPVYPMRLSAAAEHDQPLRLYVLADHRMDVSNPAPEGAEPDLTYANWVRPADLDDFPLLAERVSGERFLTRYDAWVRPELIVDDIAITQASTNEQHHAVVTQYRYVQRPSGLEQAAMVALWIAGIAAVLGIGTLLALWLRRRRRS